LRSNEIETVNTSRLQRIHRSHQFGRFFADRCRAADQSMGTLKLQDWTLQDWTMTDECVGS